MSSKKKSSGSKAKAKAKSAPKQARREPVDTGVRQLVSKAVVISLAIDQKKCLLRSGEASQDFSTSMRSAQERGINPVAFRLATRLTRTAERDPAKALVTKEDFDYYLDCLGFDRMTSKSMFAASEVRSGKKSSAKKNGKAAPEPQTDIEHDTALAQVPDEPSEIEAASEAVH
jgi:hypothetical protein